MGLHVVVGRAEQGQVLEFTRSVVGVVAVAVVGLEAESLATPRDHAGAVPYEQSAQGLLRDIPAGLGDGADIPALFDDELEGGLTEQLDRRLDRDRADALDLTDLPGAGGPPLECFGIDNDHDPGSGRGVGSPARTQQVDEGIEAVGLIGVLALGSCRLEASPGGGFEAGADPGPGHLVTEELAPDSSALDLVPAERAPRVDPGPAGVLAFLDAGGGLHLLGLVRHLLMAGVSLEHLEQGRDRFGVSAGRVGEQAQLGGTERPLAQGIGQLGHRGRPLGRRQLALGHPGR
jgi:hypothetical protein